MDFGTCLEHRQEKSIECPICVIEERDQLRAEVERLRGELEQARAAEREQCIEAVRYAPVESAVHVRDELALAIEHLKYRP
jgi:hypothetical protein